MRTVTILNPGPRAWMPLEATGHAAENFSLLNRIALNFVRQDKTSQIGIHGKRLQAAWDHDYLLRLPGVDRQRKD